LAQAAAMLVLVYFSDPDITSARQVASPPASGIEAARSRR